MSKFQISRVAAGLDAIVEARPQPRLEEVGNVPGPGALVDYLSSLGVASGEAVLRPPTTVQERARAHEMLEEAATRGYLVARAALPEEETRGWDRTVDR